jgi:acyl carrier protein
MSDIKAKVIAIIPDDKAEGIQTVGDAIAYIEANV